MNNKDNEISIELEYLLEAGISDVFNFLSNPENDILWQSSCAKVNRTEPEQPITTGSKYIIHFRFLSRSLVFETEVTEYQSDNCYGYVSLKGPIHYQGRYEFNQCEQGVMIKWTFGALLGKFFGIIPKSIIKKTMLKKATEDIEYLKTMFKNVDTATQHKEELCQV